MKVSGVCPNCHRPVSSKAKGVCLYCGSAIAAVDTGQVSAAGSGAPLSTEQVEKLAPAAPPPVPRPSKNVPNLYADRAARMQAEEINPIAEFFRSGAGKFTIWAGSILLVIGGIVWFIDDQRPKNVDLSTPKESLSDIAKGKKWAGNAPPPEAPPAAAPAPAAAPIKVFEDENTALGFIADQILASVPRGMAFPDTLPAFVSAPAPGSDLERATAFFDLSTMHYSRTLSQDFQYEGFNLEVRTPGGLGFNVQRLRHR